MGRRNSFIWAAALLGGALLGAAPAQAAGPDWAAGVATYRQMRDAGEGPTSEMEFGQCSAMWSSWVDKALNEKRLPPAALPVMDKDLIAPDARSYAVEWALWIDYDNGAVAAYDAARPVADGAVDQALAGDAQAMQALMGGLGACTNFPDE